MKELLIAGSVLIVLIGFGAWMIKRLLRSLLDPCEDCVELHDGRLHYDGDVEVDGERRTHFKCDRCPNEVYYPSISRPFHPEGSDPR